MEEVPAGAAAPDHANPVIDLENYHLFVGGEEARLLYLGSAPGFANLPQANFEVPDLPFDGEHDLVLRYLTTASDPVGLLVADSGRNIGGTLDELLTHAPVNAYVRVIIDGKTGGKQVYHPWGRTVTAAELAQNGDVIEHVRVIRPQTPFGQWDNGPLELLDILHTNLGDGISQSDGVFRFPNRPVSVYFTPEFLAANPNIAKMRQMLHASDENGEVNYQEVFDPESAGYTVVLSNRNATIPLIDGKTRTMTGARIELKAAADEFGFGHELLSHSEGLNEIHINVDESIHNGTITYTLRQIMDNNGLKLPGDDMVIIRTIRDLAPGTRTRYYKKSVEELEEGLPPR